MAPSTATEPAEKRANFSLLPTEIVEAILARLSTLDSLTSHQTLATIAPTCRLFASICRVLLYETPYQAVTSIEDANVGRSRRALRLLRAIVSHGSIQAVVRNLARLPHIVLHSSLATLTEAGATSRATALALQCEALARCPAVKEADVLVSDDGGRRLMAETATACARLHNLQYLALDCLASDGSENRVLVAAFLRVLSGQQAGGRPLATLELNMTAHECGTDCAEIVDLAAALAGQILLDLTASRPNLVFSCFMHSQSDSLTEIRIDLPADCLHSEWLIRQSRFTSSNLRRVVFAVDTDGAQTLLADYNADSSSRPEWPAWLMSAFPAAKELSFFSGRGMTLDKLRALLRTSNSLLKLDLSDTWWELRPLDLCASCTDELSRFELGLGSLLNATPTLDHLDVGVMPFNANAYKDVEDAKWPILRIRGDGRAPSRTLAVEGCVQP